MTDINYNKMELDDLRKYVLTHREDIQAFQSYIDRSKASGRMIAVDAATPKWEEALEENIRRTAN
ncbi:MULTISPECIES: DUF6887 family protein [unclassified Pseudanabaena]|uniref:DUF6887 family protein n=1 Tax=unclassified Pseudanabaena TaxID=2593292 RepID=UPI000B97EF79|nr:MULTISPECIES: hypothetical protein [unclassified Pseudanabaena]OYQ67245.1 hypothetical protein B9G53_02535 [Pseudanabaena sp. SR411]BBC26456.1 hypothetical protein ABRG53_4199 [Pseudanabaena sp. ABRG5-3]